MSDNKNPADIPDEVIAEIREKYNDGEENFVSHIMLWQNQNNRLLNTISTEHNKLKYRMADIEETYDENMERFNNNIKSTKSSFLLVSIILTGIIGWETVQTIILLG